MVSEPVQIALIAGIAPSVLVVVTAIMQRRSTAKVEKKVEAVATVVGPPQQDGATLVKKLDEQTEFAKSVAIDAADATRVAVAAVAKQADKIEVIHVLTNEKLQRAEKRADSAEEQVRQLTAFIRGSGLKVPNGGH